MANAEVEMQCYNKGCSKKFFPSENGSACIHHPGEPVFHDAYKGWSCCNKRTTDFTEFLNIPGCAKGLHNNQKPPEKPKPAPMSKEEKDKVIVVEVAKPIKPIEPTVRPSENEPVIRLPVTVSASLKTALENLTVSTLEAKTDKNAALNEVGLGTTCKNKGCKKSYTSEQSNFEKCFYHSGKAIFHEGMKYWSCCKRKTSDFNNFLDQEGCTEGSHVWVVKEEDSKKLVDCRYDWHQTSSLVVLSVYCKNSQPDLSFVEANQVLLNVSISFNQAKNHFKKTIVVYGVIDPTKSSMTMSGSKCEIKLKKAEACSWKKYELPPATKTTAGEDKGN
ncbi:cysteine and histidine-rich domain-containing protein 1-like isoform X2 [Acanthaster planci]|uniref:Cysteine and histidine-rich domain-containing protein 1-like isoform X2 n=1 Tax=Acanthaster planci TaxID=133434 RepID=A0A8B7XQ29_ACAPL|nr:cysteine and histidine-rich domain-containing protein 1-like isoform X2 [Acanthaster planci]